MSQKPETIFRKRVRRDLEKLPYTCIISQQQVALVGIPDFIVCVNSSFVGIELKKDEKSLPAPAQLYWLDKIHNARGISLTINPKNWEEAYEMLTILSMSENAATLFFEQRTNH